MGGGIGMFDKSMDKNEIDKISKDYSMFPSRYEGKELDNRFRIRRLTPKECFRLMGFDDDDYKKAKAVNSDSQLYKQAGNSIVVDVLMNIFKQLL